MAEPTEDEVRRLAAAIRERVKEAESGVYHQLSEAWRGFTDECLLTAGIELADEEEYQLAAKWMWRSAFMGGNYTLDARRVLRAARGDLCQGCGGPLSEGVHGMSEYGGCV